MPAKKKTKAQKHRSAQSGRFVTEEYMQKNKATTYSTKPKKKK